MTTTLHRAVAGAFALLLAAAGLDVSGALAQAALPSTGEGITSTVCSNGTLTVCGHEEITRCEWKFEIDFNILGRSGGVKAGQYSCQKVGVKTLYKDVETSKIPVVGTCTSPVGGGSRGSGSVGSRGSGDDASGDESCDQ